MGNLQMAHTGFWLLGLILVCHGFPHQDLGQGESLTAFDDDEIKLESRHSLEAQTIRDHGALMESQSHLTELAQQIGATRRATDALQKKTSSANKNVVSKLKQELKSAKAAADSAWKAESLMEQRMKATATSGFNPTALADLGRLEAQLSTAETQHKKQQAVASAQGSTIKEEKKQIEEQKVAQRRVAKERDAAAKQARALRKRNESQKVSIQNKKRELHIDRLKLKTSTEQIKSDKKEMKRREAKEESHKMSSQKDEKKAKTKADFWKKAEATAQDKDLKSVVHKAIARDEIKLPESEAKLEAKDEERDVAKVVRKAQQSEINNQNKDKVENKIESHKSQAMEVKEGKTKPKEVKSKDTDTKKSPKSPKSQKSDLANGSSKSVEKEHTEPRKEARRLVRMMIASTMWLNRILVKIPIEMKMDS